MEIVLEMWDYSEKKVGEPPQEAGAFNYSRGNSKNS
tara:strand:- start:1148 stop:1255 length:108 start_codon:yes stop_codon:yes gene_type:complete